MNYAFLRDDTIGKIQVLPHENLKVVQEKFKALRSSEEYAHQAYIKNIPHTLADYKIELSVLTSILEKTFQSVGYVENKTFLLLRENLEDIIAYRVNEDSFVYVSYDSRKIVQDIFFVLYLDVEKQKLLEFLANLQEKYHLILVDWDRFFVASIIDESVDLYFDENIARYKESFEKINFEKKSRLDEKIYKNDLETKLYALGFFLGIAYLEISLITETVSTTLSMMVLIQVLFVSCAYTCLSVLGFKVKTTKNGLYITKKYRTQYYTFNQINSAIIGNTFICLNVNHQDITRNIYIDTLFFDKPEILQQFIRDNTGTQNCPESNIITLAQKAFVFFGAKNLWISFSEAHVVIRKFGYRELNIFNIYITLLLIKCKLITRTPLDLFRIEFSWVSWEYFGGTKYFDIDIVGIPLDKNTRYFNYNSTTKENLTIVGGVFHYTYTIHIGESGKLYCSYLNYLFLYGESYHEWLDNLFQWKPPIKTYNLLDDSINIYDYASNKWNGALSPLYTLDLIYRDFLTRDTALYGKNLLPLLKHEKDDEFVVYNLDDGKSYYIGRWVDEDKTLQIIPLENVDDMKKYLWVSSFHCDFMFPRVYCDSIIKDMNNALDLDMSDELMHTIIQSDPSQKEYHFPEKDTTGRNGFMIDVSNKDWYYLFSFFTEIKIPKVEACLAKYREKIEGEYDVAHKNFLDYYGRYPKSFFNPIVNLNPIDMYLTEKIEPNEESEFFQYSLITHFRYTHEIVLDICSILWITVDLDYLQKIQNNDGILWIHCLGIFNSDKIGEFVVIDCQNIDSLNGCIVRCLKEKHDKIRRRLIEWENYSRYQKTPMIPCKDLPNDILEEDNYLDKILDDYGLTEKDIYTNNPVLQFDHLGGMIHKIKIFVRNNPVFQFFG